MPLMHLMKQTTDPLFKHKQTLHTRQYIPKITIIKLQCVEIDVSLNNKVHKKGNVILKT